MGVLPLQFLPGESVAALGLTGGERFTIRGIAQGLTPRQRVVVEVADDAGGSRSFDTLCRLDGAIEVDYYAAGGIRPAVLRRLAPAGAAPRA
jgi:aconitate hydratase